jgi:4-hydroxy-3-polyprenylbenzoate decarboxylase
VNPSLKLVVAVTGASGSIYAKNFLEAAKSHGIETYLIVTEAGKTVAGHELGGVEKLTAIADHIYNPNDLEAPLASGSFRVDGMVIVPATMKTVAALAHGYNANLVTRAADVHIKERRPLIVVPRETPLHAVHLENMARLSRLGAVILPAMPGFYHHPESVDDLASFISGKILDQLGVPNNLYRRWGGP